MAINFDDKMMEASEGPSIILAQGIPGQTPSFSIGEVKSVSPDAGAKVKMGGTVANPILDFELPRGVSGSESINDNAGEGDTDFVWSADRSYGEVSRIDGNITDVFGNGNAQFLADKKGIFVNSSNQEVANVLFRCSDYIEIPAGAAAVTMSIYYRDDTAFSPYYLTYDSDKTLLRVYYSGNVTHHNGIITVPIRDDEKYIRFNQGNDPACSYLWDFKYVYSSIKPLEMYFDSDNIYAPYDDLNTLPTNIVASYISNVVASIAHKPSGVSTWFTVFSYGWRSSTMVGSIQILTVQGTGTSYIRTCTAVDTFTDWTKIQNYIGASLTSMDYSFTSDNLTAPYDDLDTFPVNKIASYVSSAAAVTANAPTNLWFTIISYNYTVNQMTSGVQLAVEVGTGKMYYRIKSSAFSPWMEIGTDRKIYIAGSGTYKGHPAYTTFKEGMEAAYALGDCTVIVGNGTYDLLAEYGSDFLDNYSEAKSCGLMIGNNVTVIFDNDAKVTANYTGNNDLIKTYFSPLNVTGSFKLVNVEIEVQNVRYCVHEDIVTATSNLPDSYTAEYIDCRMVNNGSNLSGWYSMFCIGAGATPNGRTKIIRGQYIANNTRHVPIFWHNSSVTSNKPSYVIMEGIILGEGDHFHFRRISENGNTVVVSYSNCLLGDETTYADGAPDKFDITEWNNVLRSDE